LDETERGQIISNTLTGPPLSQCNCPQTGIVPSAAGSKKHARQCFAIDETGERCRVLKLHDRCYKHRRQQDRTNVDAFD
jgi:hypothetical protein